MYSTKHDYDLTFASSLGTPFCRNTSGLALWRTCCFGCYINSVCVAVRPVVTVMPAAPLVVGSGSGILVTCTAANGRPAAEVSWRIDQLDGPVETVKNMTENPNGTTTVRSYLLVTPTRSMHGREVQCVVNHTALQHEDIVPYRISLHLVMCEITLFWDRMCLIQFT
uniref:Ig-like domain-containing protein n=1 Tax=Paramormyrops kingsleyae TaxID=1676925 RepID=A0A3B3S6X2_9TELE